jgi:hypothetical protein
MYKIRNGTVIRRKTIPAKHTRSTAPAAQTIIATTAPAAQTIVAAAAPTSTVTETKSFFRTGWFQILTLFGI